MCYSALVQADYRRFKREFGAQLDLKAFHELFWRRRSNPDILIPKSMEQAFLNPQSDLEAEIKGWIEEHAITRGIELEQDLFKQRQRLADAQRKLATKFTKKASEDERIAAKKTDWLLGLIADAKRTSFEERDARIYPGMFAPVLVMDGGQRMVRPMRFHCRPAGSPAGYDKVFKGNYCARRDNLKRYWRALYGHTHAVLVADAFYENVARHLAEGRELRENEKPENLVIEFKPSVPQDMLVACIWSRWSGEGEPDLDSFAVITTDPPPEVSSAGHDRCVIPVQAKHVDAWLTASQATNRDMLDAILSTPEPVYFAHRMAA
jgi:putative SOS response-associated peptidase YedK